MRNKTWFSSSLPRIIRLSVHRHFCAFAARLHTSASTCFRVKATTGNNWIKLNPFNSAFKTCLCLIKKVSVTFHSLSLRQTFSKALMWLILDVAKKNTLLLMLLSVIAKQHNGITITKLLSHLCFGLKKSLSWTKQIKTFVQSAAQPVTLWGDRFRGFMSLIRKFHLDLTLLWCPTVVSITWVRYRKCRVTSVVSASRQPLHWTAPCTAAQWH